MSRRRVLLWAGAAMVLAAYLAVPAGAGAAVAWRSEEIYSTPPVTTPGTELTGMEDVAIGDVTGDGLDDVVGLALNREAGLRDLVVLPGTGTDALGSPVMTKLTGDDTYSPRTFALGNLNGDAALDVVVGTVGSLPNQFGSMSSSGHVVTLLADGSGGFSSQTEVPGGAIIEELKLMNANGDSLSDIVLAGQVGFALGGVTYDVKIGINNGDGTYTFPNELRFDFPGNHVRNSLSIGDLNGGNDDIVVADGAQVDLMLSGPGGSYTTATQAAAANVCSTAIGDFNTDGLGDVVDGTCAGGASGFTGTTEVFGGTSAGTFAPLTTVLSDGDVRDAVAGDFDLPADGRQDLMVVNVGVRSGFPTTGRLPSLVNWIRNDPSGLQVRPMTERPVPNDTGNRSGTGGTITAGQVNGDGIPDVAVTTNFGLILFRSFDDIVPPETEILPSAAAPPADASPAARSSRAKPIPVRHRKRKVYFAANEAGSAFTCQFDKRPATECRSPALLPVHMRPGKHVFTVVATDLAGNSDPEPAQVRIRVPKRRHHSPAK